MRITIMGYGTYGDVLPYAALGVALSERGHTVVLAAPAAYDGLTRTAGLTLHPLAGDPRS